MSLKTLIDTIKNTGEEVAYLAEYSPDILRGFYYQWKKHVSSTRHRSMEDIVKEVKEKTGHDSFNIIGHSFGGLAGLVYTMENPEKVKHYLAIGTPFKGTPLAYLAFVLLNIGVIPKAAMQMIPDCDFIQAVGRYFSRHNHEFEKRGIVFENIRSSNDEFVPFRYSSLKELCPEARNITEYTMSGKGHVTIAHNEHVYRHIAGIIADSKVPTIFIPGFGLNGGFFERVLKGVKEAYPGLISDDKMSRIFHLEYDYTKPINADKIMADYDSD
ncbi:MAG: alpha/beta fold hydrolase [Nanoarchaeota archaeon]